jgi:hypothetical protein
MYVPVYQSPQNWGSCKEVARHWHKYYDAVHLATTCFVQNFPPAIKNTDFIPLGKMFLLKIQTNPQEGFLIGSKLSEK